MPSDSAAREPAHPEDCKCLDCDDHRSDAVPAENSAKSGTSDEKSRGRPFEPGKSGNPGGRPKGIERVRDLCRAKTELMVLTLATIATNRRINAGARVRAAEAILDRGWGKANQPISGPDDGPIKFQDERAEVNRKLEAMFQAALQANKAAEDDGDKSDGDGSGGGPDGG